MKVLLISLFKDEIIGGVSTHSTNLYNRLVEDDIEVEKISVFNIISSTTILVKTVRAIQLLFTVLFKFDRKTIYHFHTSNKAYHFYALAPFLKILGRKVVLSIHSGVGYTNFLTKYPLFKNINRFYFKIIDYVVFMNNKEAESIRKVYPKLQSTFVSVNPYIAPVLQNEFGEKISINNRFEVVCIGAWIPRYNLEECIQALRMLFEQFNIKSKLTYVNSSMYLEQDYKDMIMSMLNSSNTFLEYEVFEDLNDVFPILKNKHLLLRPAKGDSYGLCVAESLLVGVPVVASDVCKRCDNAALYKYGDLDTLVHKIKEIYDSYPMVKKSLLDSSEDSYFKYLKIYESLCK